MRLLLFIVLLIFVGESVHALNLTGFWYTDGDQKMARQDLYPGGLIGNTTSQMWDGTTVTQYSAKGESIGGALYLLNNSGADATNVMVSVSSMTCQGGTGIVSVAVSSTNVWDISGRPMQLFLAQYIQMVGLSVFPYAHDDIEERKYPTNFRTPFVVQGSGQGLPTPATNLFSNRTDGNKFYPVGLVPMEEFAISSFTVAKSSSQAVWIDTWVSTTIPPGKCTGTIKVTEGVNVSTTIPYVINVWNFKLPTLYSFPAFAYVQQNYVTLRQANDEFPNPGQDSVPPHSDTLNHYDQMLRAHGFSFTSGDALDASTNDFPSSRKQAEITGTTYTSAKGYGNARGYAIGDPRYIIGQYGGPFDSHWSTTTLSGSTGFETNASSWAFYCSNAGIKCSIYTPNDEGTTAQINALNPLAQLLSTSPASGYNGFKLDFIQTGDLPIISSTAPYIDSPMSTAIFDNFAPASATWQTQALAYETTAQFWRYNNGPQLGSGAPVADEEEGFGPREVSEAFWLKGITGYMSWDATYYKDDDVTGNENDLYNQAVTFGGRTTNDNTFGLSGFDYSQGDGVWMWYGNDALNVGGNPYGFDGPIATWQLKMFRRGIQDYDYMNLAYAVNPSSTTAMVRALNSKILWEVTCHDPADCTYVFGDRGWSQNPNDYTNTLISLGNLAAMGTTKQLTGNVKLKGGGVLK